MTLAITQVLSSEIKLPAKSLKSHPAHQIEQIAASIQALALMTLWPWMSITPSLKE